MPVNRKIIAGIIAVLLILLILEMITFFSLTYMGITGNDLVLYVKEDAANIDVTRGDMVSVQYTTGLQNLLFCTAECAWDIVDMRSGQIIDGGTMTLKSGAEKHIRTTVKSSEQRSKTAVQMRVTCQNLPYRYCKSAGETHQAGAVTKITTVYSKSEAKAATSVEQELPSWLSSANGQYKHLLNLRANADTIPERFTYIQKIADEDIQALKSQIQQMQEAGEKDDVLQVSRMLSTPPIAKSLTLYDEERQREAQLEEETETIVANHPSRVQKYFFSDDQEAQETFNAVNEYLTAVENPSTTLIQIQKSVEKIKSADLNLETPTFSNEQAMQGENLLFQEKMMICKIKGGPCPSSPGESNSAIERIMDVCIQMHTLEDIYASAQKEYLTSLIPNESNITNIEIILNLASVRSNPEWNTQETNLLENARNGVPVSDNTTIRAAVRLESSTETIDFRDSICPSLKPTIPEMKKYSVTLPILSPEDVPDETITFPPTQCCLNNQCQACFAKEQPYPVLFVHGHAFVFSTAPEQSLEAFSAMSFKLQEDNIPYIGRIYPDLQYDPGLENQFAGFGVPFTAHGTYYYDAYKESNTITRVVHKSESIETYSIRLQESIKTLKQRTGSDKVIIVAHSMGGLVTRRYIQIFGENDVAAFVMIGTPNQGISGKTLSLCPWFGAEKECTDMTQGSIFIKKVNGGAQPTIPTYIIAGTGCDGETDGVVPTEDVTLPWAKNYVVNGTCPTTTELLHNTLLDPQKSPEVYNIVKSIIEQNTEKK